MSLSSAPKTPAGGVGDFGDIGNGASNFRRAEVIPSDRGIVSAPSEERYDRSTPPWSAGRIEGVGEVKEIRSGLLGVVQTEADENEDDVDSDVFSDVIDLNEDVDSRGSRVAVDPLLG